MKPTRSTRPKRCRIAHYLSLAVGAHALALSGGAGAQQAVGPAVASALGCALDDGLTACDFVERQLDAILEVAAVRLDLPLGEPLRVVRSEGAVPIRPEDGECSLDGEIRSQRYALSARSPLSLRVGGNFVRQPLVLTAEAPVALDLSAEGRIRLRERLFGRCRTIGRDTFRLDAELLGTLVGTVEVRANPRLETLASGDLLLTLAPDVSFLASLVEPELSFEIFDASFVTELFIRSKIDTEEHAANAVEEVAALSGKLEEDLRQDLSEALKLDSNGELRFRVAKDFKERIARDGEAAAVFEALN